MTTMRRRMHARIARRASASTPAAVAAPAAPATPAKASIAHRFIVGMAIGSIWGLVITLAVLAVQGFMAKADAMDAIVAENSMIMEYNAMVAESNAKMVAVNAAIELRNEDVLEQVQAERAATEAAIRAVQRPLRIWNGELSMR